jgi:hypothetical protein
MPAPHPLVEPWKALNNEDPPTANKNARSPHISEAALQRIDLKLKAGTKGDVLPTRSQMITWIDEESKQEHIGTSAWKKASKSTICPLLVERAAQWGKTKTGPAKPIYRAVAHTSFRNSLCNAVCRSLCPLDVRLY